MSHRNWHPQCFTLEEWHKWVTRARQAVRVGAAKGYNYCSDCTCEYQALMKEQGRCARPEYQPRYSLPLTRTA